MARTVRGGIVGMGIGKPNARAIARHPRGEVTALCDLDEERMAAFSAELPGEVKCYTDYKAMCRDPELDAVFVGTPNQWHVPVALEAVRRLVVTALLLEAGAHIREGLGDRCEAARGGKAGVGRGHKHLCGEVGPHL